MVEVEVVEAVVMEVAEAVEVVVVVVVVVAVHPITWSGANRILRNLPKRLELLLRSVRALPNASSTGVVSRIFSVSPTMSTSSRPERSRAHRAR